MLNTAKPSQENCNNAPTGKGLVIDVQVVRRVLKVNPALRAGRTTMQVKRDLEGHGKEKDAVNVAPEQLTGRPNSSSGDNDNGDAASEVFWAFLQHKANDWQASYAQILEQERQLKCQLEMLKKNITSQIQQCLQVVGVSGHRDVAAYSKKEISILKTLNIDLLKIVQ